MSEWSDRFKQSPVWEHLKAVGTQIDNAEALADLPPEHLEALERARTVLTFVGKRLATLDPLLIHQGQLDAASNALQNLADQLLRYATTADLGHLANARGHGDDAVYHVNALPAPTDRADLEGLGEAATAYREALKREFVAAKELGTRHHSELAGITTRVAEITTELAALRERTAAVVTDLQGQFSQGQAARQERFDKFFGDAQSEVSKAQGTWAQEYNAAQADRQQRFDALITEHTKRLNERAAEYEKDAAKAGADHATALSELTASYKARAEAVLKEIEHDRDEVKKLLGVIGTDGVTSGYQKAADESRGRARLWQLTTVGAMLVLVAIGLIIFFTAHGDFHWSEFAGRAFLAIALGVLAAYGASQADKHLGAERMNRRSALELEAVGPYLAPLPEADRHAFRIALGQRTFGKEDPLPMKPSPATTLDILKETKEIVTEVAKAARPEK